MKNITTEIFNYMMCCCQTVCMKTVLFSVHYDT